VVGNSQSSGKFAFVIKSEAVGVPLSNIMVIFKKFSYRLK